MNWDHKEYEHWKQRVDSQGVLWITLDRLGADTNSMNHAVLTEFDALLDDVIHHLPIALIILSGKSNGFIAGADVHEFQHLKNPGHALGFIKEGQRILNKLEQLPIPTVAVIHGFCLGGGLELALACDYRIAESGHKTQLGFPEVKLGIHPGWGGTVRLVKLIGVFQAMPVLLSGRSLSVDKAYKVHMVDKVLPKRSLKRAALYFATRHPKLIRANRMSRCGNYAICRSILGIFFEKQLAKKVSRKHYPAPYAIVDHWKRAGVSDQAFTLEAQSVSELLFTDTARQLVRIFFLRERLKGFAKTKSMLVAEPSSTASILSIEAFSENRKHAGKIGVLKAETDSDIKHIHIIGAGTMGGDIAIWCAFQGLSVTLQDQDASRVGAVIQKAYGFCQKELKHSHLVQQTMDRLTPDLEGAGIKKSDIVLEAIFENVDAKKKLFHALEKELKPMAILATNTSSIPLNEIGTVLQHPDLLVGAHFFNPVFKMPLLEIVSGESGSVNSIKKMLRFAGIIHKLPIVVCSQPGFLINRLLMPYLLESVVLLEEGLSVACIDQVAVAFGMPMGPLALADQLGLDICLSVGENLVHCYGGYIPEPLIHLVKANHLGVKTGRGFYQYTSGKRLMHKVRKKKLKNSDTKTIQDRLILRIVNEAVACLKEGVISDADLLDAGMVLGTGFAPFSGGPIQYAKSRGVQEVVSVLEKFSKEYGERFKPHAGWSLISEHATFGIPISS